MSKAVKALIRDELAQAFEKIDGGVFISTQGLDSEHTAAFRKAMHERKLHYTMIRNALARQAFQRHGYKGAQLEQVLKGMIGILYTDQEGSAMAAARALTEWKKQSKDKLVEWKGAFLDGEVMGAKDAQALKDAPTKEQARAMLLGVMQAPVTQLLGTVREGYARVVYVLQSYHDKKNETKSDTAAGAAAS